MLVGAALAFFGFIHAGTLGPSGGIYAIGFGSGSPWAAGYALCATFFSFTGVWAKRSGQSDQPVEDSLAGHG